MFTVSNIDTRIMLILLISNFMTSQPSQQTIVLHILPNISRIDGNQTMKFGHLIERNMRNVFLEKSFTKCGGQTSPRPCSEILKRSISLDQQSKVLYSLPLLYGQVEVTCFHLISSFFQKTKRGLGLLSLSHFPHNI